ncbi:RluA family pseudouridine synthase [Sporomusa aerivorans]|uniref:RluA family pseudouridine synthase n=1 Tax=Sporomusa aerivorans TaxID=204936 RepID=UPI00352ACA88
MPEFVVPPNISPQPVKDYLRRRVGLSLTLWRKIKTTGTLLINALPATICTEVHPGDTISVTWPEASSIIAEALPLAIAYEDDWLLVADKPTGMLVHPAAGQHSGTLANAIMHYYHQQSYSCGFHPVNRLDRNTSGLVLIAKRPDIQHWLNQNQNSITKEYLAIVSGTPAPANGQIDAPIGRKPNSIIEREVRPDGQQAITHYRILTSFGQASLLEVLLKTGRTHQIRVHFCYIGCPLLGDDLYGGPVTLITRQALHAAKLSLPHPVSGQVLTVTSPLPADLVNVLSTLGGKKLNML